MSTAVVVKKDGQVAIGADTLTRLGAMKRRAEYVERGSKIMQLGESYIAIVGSAAMRQVLDSYFAQHRKAPPLDSRESIFEMARKLHGAMKQDYFLNPSEDDDDPFESSRMDCLIANPSGIFGLYALRSVQEFARFWAFGSGDEYALGAMRVAYPTASSAEEIARAGLEAAADFDASTDLPMEVHTIALKRP